MKTCTTIEVVHVFVMERLLNYRVFCRTSRTCQTCRTIGLVGHLGEIAVIIEYIFIDFIEYCLSVMSTPRELSETYRVRGIACKSFLIDIDAYAYNTSIDSLSTKGIFDENATKFMITDINIVWPFDCYFLTDFICCCLRSSA